MTEVVAVEAEQRASGRASFAQEQLWLAEQAVPGTEANNTALAWDLCGPADGTILRRCVDELAVRHPALRTVLRYSSGELTQVVRAPAPADFECLTAADSGEAGRLLDDRLSRPFRLSAELPFRAVLIRITAGHHVLALMAHHSACDGVSTAVLCRELGELYTAYHAGSVPDLEPEGASYLRFAEWEQAAWRSRADLATGWLEHLKTADAHASLGGGRPRPVGPAGSVRFQLPTAGLARLLGRAGHHGVTANMAIMAVFAVALSRWTGQRKVVFSVPVATRPDQRFRQTVGVFVNSMPILFDLGSNPPFGALLESARTEVLAAIEHAHVPPGLVRAALSARAPGRDRLHQATLNVRAMPPAGPCLPQVATVERQLGRARTSFGLSLRIELAPPHARAELEYDRDAIGDGTAGRFAELVNELIADAHAAERLSDLPTTPASDRARVTAWCAGPSQDDVPDLVAQVSGWTRRTPEAIAVQAAQRAMSYVSLWHESGRYAAALRELGVHREDVVAVCLPRSADLVAAILGTLRAEAAFIPLDWRGPADRTDQLLCAANPAALIALDDSPGGHWAGPVIRSGQLAQPACAARALAGQHAAGHMLAYVIYTSGSTGTPKGVMVTRRALANYLRWAVSAYRIGPGDVVPLHTSPAFDLAITALLAPLYGGGQVQVLAEDLELAGLASRLGSGYRVVKSTPSQLRAVLDVPGPRGGRGPGMLVFGGEQLTAEHASRWTGRFPDLALVNEYGPTETTVASTAFTITGPVDAEVIPIGRPVANTWVQVVNATLEPVPVGVSGELVIGGAGVARGYLRGPALTAARFVPDPFGKADGGRLYRTGDVARWREDGQLELQGRTDDQVKILGHRVEPGEVEAILARCPGLRAAAVVATTNSARSLLVAFIVPGAEPASRHQPESARSWLRDQLPPYLVPERFVIVDRLPMAGSGKVDRSALRASAAAQLTAPGRSADLQTGWHEIVKQAWSAVLARDSVPDDVSFFDAGGSSLLLLQLHTALLDCGIPLSVTDLFRYPTISGLAIRISELAGGEANAVLVPSRPALVRTSRRTQLGGQDDS